MLALKTYHGLYLSFDMSTQKLIQSVPIKDSVLQSSHIVPVIFEPSLIASTSGEAIGYLTFYLSNSKFYITSILSDFRCEYTIVCPSCCNYFIKKIGNGYAFQLINGFVSARQNAQLGLKPWIKEWEIFNVDENIFRFPKKEINIHFWNRKFGLNYNFGDVLNKYIVEKMLDCTVKFTPLMGDCFVAIGSMINVRTLKAGACFWGTGTFNKSLPYFKGNRFCAVRGPLTRYTLISSGYNCPDIYGDPALLMPQYYKPSRIQKKYKIGVICHWRHRDLLNLDPDVKFIDILRKDTQIESFVDDILECEKVISSSLHGIIVAHAYGIPARWFVIPSLTLEGDPTKKFYDYFASVQMPLQTPLEIAEKSRVNNGVSLLVDNELDLRIDLELLKNSFPIDRILFE